MTVLWIALGVLLWTGLGGGYIFLCLWINKRASR